MIGLMPAQDFLEVALKAALHAIPDIHTIRGNAKNVAPSKTTRRRLLLVQWSISRHTTGMPHWC